MGGAVISKPSKAKVYVLHTQDLESQKSSTKSRSRNDRATFPPNGSDCIEEGGQLINQISKNSAHGNGRSSPGNGATPTGTNGRNSPFEPAVDGTKTPPVAEPQPSEDATSDSAVKKGVMTTFNMSHKAGCSASSSRSNHTHSHSSSKNHQKTVCSRTHKWLLKKTNVAGSQLSDYEMGKIIGTIYR
jgi:hypothetical protein